MATITNPHSSANYTHTISTEATQSNFTKWCQSLEPVRFMVMSFILMVQTCVIAPAVVLLSSFFDKGITAPTIALAAFSTMAVMVSNISLLPMKAIIITFIICLVINLSLIAVHLF